MDQTTEQIELLKDIQDTQENTNNILDGLSDILVDQEQKQEIAKDQEADARSQEVEEQATRDQEQAQTYEEILTDIKTNIDLTNHFLVGNMFFISVLIGVLIGKIIWDRFIKL